MDFPASKPDSAAAREAKNQMAFTGEIDRAFKAIMESNEPDAIHALLVGLVHKSVDVAHDILRVGAPPGAENGRAV